MPALDLRELGWTTDLAASLDPDLVPGRVAVHHRGAYAVYTERGEVRARLPGRLVRRGQVPVVGDWVGLRDGSVGAILPRRSAIVRNAAGAETIAQVLAANVDVAFVVTSPGPDLDLRRLERYLTLVWESGAVPIVVVTKADLYPDAAEQALAIEAVAVGVHVLLASGVTGEGCDSLAVCLQGSKTAVLLGSSGVGKSTLVNRLAGIELMRTRAVRDDDGKGRHTTTHRELVVLPGRGVLIDTPGLREVQLWEASDGFGAAFADVDQLAAGCRFSDCSHTREPGCAVLAAVDDGILSLDRLRSYRQLERELRAHELRRGDRAALAERRRAMRRFERSRRRDAW